MRRRLPWAHVEQLEAVGKRGIAVAGSMVTKMKARVAVALESFGTFSVSVS